MAFGRNNIASHETAQSSRAIARPAAVVLLFLVLLPGPAWSQDKTFCSEPVEPFCIDRSSAFEGKSEELRCRSEVEEYLKEMAKHAQCVGEQQKEVRERASKVERRLACLTQGRSDCS